MMTARGLCTRVKTVRSTCCSVDLRQDTQGGVRSLFGEKSSTSTPLSCPT
jgi:hypothetical protein